MKTLNSIPRFFLLIVLLFISFSFGYSLHNSSVHHATEKTFYARKLQISAETNKDNPSTLIQPETFGENCSTTLSYLNLSNVIFNVGDRTVPLEKAIQNGDITAEEIFAYARLDARHGICVESSDTKNGLTAFTYHYPEFNIRLTYDIYQTPNNGAYLIDTILLSDPETDIGVYTDYLDPNSSFGYKLDREDWGITLKINHVTPSLLSVDFNHAGGQHFGELQIDSYLIMDTEWNTIAFHSYDRTEYNNSLIIPQNQVSSFTINWGEYEEPLPKGNYILRLLIKDNYDNSNIHPFTQNYRDYQPYILYFTVP